MVYQDFKKKKKGQESSTNVLRIPTNMDVQSIVKNRPASFYSLVTLLHCYNYNYKYIAEFRSSSAMQQFRIYITNIN